MFNFKTVHCQKAKGDLTLGYTNDVKNEPNAAMS